MAKKQSPSTLLWFIRRKAYVPLCEIRRRFELESDEVEGGFISDGQGQRLFVGLPQSSCASIEKLWGQGKIGLDLSVEFDCRVVIGVFPMVPSRDMQQEGNGRTPRPLTAVTPIQVIEAECPDEEFEEEDGPPALAAVR